MNSAWLYNRNRILRQRSEESMRQQQISNAQPNHVNPTISTDLPLEQTMLLLLNDDITTVTSIGTGLTGPA
jgi:hypothetical protein